MAKQLDLIKWEQRVFNPDADQHEPVIWIREIRFFSAFNPDAELKRFELRKGINIVWAKAFQGNVELGQNGMSGHAAGKTTFCRIMRYILGEPQLGTQEFRVSLAQSCPNAVFIADVRVAGQTWIVCRSPALSGQEFVCKGEGITDAFSKVISRHSYDTFLIAINDAIIPRLSSASLPKKDAVINWNFILPWLSRDQDCRYAQLLNWRAADSESGAPQTSFRNNAFIIRSICGLVSSGEESVAAKHQALKETEQSLVDELPKLTYRLKTDKERLQIEIPELGINEGPLLFDAKLKELDKQLNQLESDPDHNPLRDAVNEAEEKYNEIIAEIAVAQDHLKQEQADLDSYSDILNSLRRKKQKEADDEFEESQKKGPADKCNIPIEVAIASCELAQEFHQIPFETANAIKSIEDKIDIWERSVSKRILLLKERKTEVADLFKMREKVMSQLVHAREKLSSKEKDIFREHLHAVSLKKRLKQLEESEAKQQQANIRLRRTKSDVAKLSDKLKSYRQKLKDKRADLSNIFEDILKAVLGSDVHAEIEYQAEGIKLDVLLDGQRNSAATRTIAIWSFDLACMIYSVEGYGSHPRFLIHDSPREADMSPDIYQRFFLYMQKMEECFSTTDNVNYQYIITTTEPPPEDLQKMPWCRLELDASSAAGRLLGVNL